MSVRTFPRFRSLLLAGLVLLALAGTGLALRGPTGESAPRKIELVAESMEFAGKNPTLAVRPGETVTFELANRDPGMIHDLAIPELAASTGPVKAGETRTLVVTFPDRPGRWEYLCTYHPITMRGRIEALEK